MLSIIQEYSNHLEEIFENSFDYIYLHDKKGNILDVNDVVIKNLGYSKNEILKMKVTDFLLEEVILEVSDEIKKTIETGVVNKPKTYKVKKQDGNFIYVEANAIPLKQDGKFYAILGIGHDITAHVEVEQKLKESEEKYYHLFNKSPFNVSLFDIDGNLIETNGTIIRKLAEYADIDFKGQNFIEIASHFANSKEIIQLLVNRFKDLREGKPLDSMEICIITMNGRKIWLHWQSSKVEINDKIFIQVIIRDITERKEAEQRLFESEEKYRLITETANDLIRVLNNKFEIEFVNESAHINTLGYSKEELFGKTDIFLNHPDEYKAIRRFMRKVFKNGEGTHESRNRHKNGQWIWFEVKVKMFNDERGNTKYLIISRDINDRKKSEQELKDHVRMQNNLNKIITIGNESTSLQEFLANSYDELLDIVGFDRGGVYLYDPKTQHNSLVLHKNLHPDFVKAVKDVYISKGVPAEIFDKNKPYYIEDFSEFMEGSKELGIYSAVIVPLRSKDQYVGSLNIGSPIHHTLPQNELELLVAIGKQMGIIIQKFESEKMLKESETKFRSLFENARDGILLADRDTRKFLTGNKRITEMLGYSLEEIEKLSVPDIHPKDKLPYIIEQFEKQVRGEIDMANDIPVRRKDGSIFYADINASQIQLGDKIYLIGIFRDITEHKQTEHMLEDRAKKLELLNEIIIKGSQAQEIEILLEDILKLTIEMMDFDGGGIYLIKENPKIAELICHRGLPLDFVEFVQAVPIEEEPYKKVFIDKEPLLIENYSKIRPELFEKWGFLSVASVPLYSKEHVIGALNITSKRRYFFTEEEKEILKSIGSQIGTAIEKIRAEQALKESEEKFRAITEQSFMSIMVIQDGILKYFNERLLKGIGYSAEEIRNWKPYEFIKVIHPDYRDFVLEQVKKKEDGKEDIQNNYIYCSIRKDGSIGWVENFSKTINYGGRPADLVTSMDITDKIEAERILRESEEKFRVITEQSFIGAIIEQDFDIRYINPQFAKIVGVNLEELLHWKIPDFFEIIHPEDLNNFKDIIDKKTKDLIQDIENFQFRIIKKTGELIWVDLYSKAIMYQNKPANLAFIMDISDKKEAEQLVIEENERLLELHELRKDIITRVSHELKTPMTSIYGANQILIKLYMDEIGEEAQKYVEIGHRGALRLKQLIDNLLDISRLDAKRIDLKLQNENLIDLIIDSVKDMNYLAANRQLKLKLDLPNEAYINIDRLRFRQVLSNIISNAIKNTPKEGEILINLDEKADYIDIQIKDTGVGITEKEREKLFEKFGKIERYGMDLGVDIEGSGLGLYISKEIVELHGGQIFVESEGRNKGSTFIIRLNKN